MFLLWPHEPAFSEYLRNKLDSTLQRLPWVIHVVYTRDRSSLFLEYVHTHEIVAVYFYCTTAFIKSFSQGIVMKWIFCL